MKTNTLEEKTTVCSDWRVSVIPFFCENLCPFWAHNQAYFSRNKLVVVHDFFFSTKNRTSCF